MDRMPSTTPHERWNDLPQGLPQRLRTGWPSAWHLGCSVLLTCSVSTALAAPPPALTLAARYHPGLEVQAYWVSEKYDGVRAHWDGQQLLSRQGLPISTPAWFTLGWPATPLDGELWAGRGQFAAVQSTVAQGAAAPDAQWRRVRYMVFDLPAHTGPFSARYPALQQAVARLQQPWVQAVPQWQVDSHATLQRQLQQQVRAGAEGLMLRRADAPYRSGRSDDLVKLKLHDDAEAEVVAHLPGQGKYHGMTGALEVQLPNGQRLRLGSGLSDADRRHPPPVGSTVTYRYQGLHASGLPRFARFWRVRADSPPPAATPQPSPQTAPRTTVPPTTASAGTTTVPLSAPATRSSPPKP